ncbi:MAG TPA: isoamylase early set domain-containing protein [Mycobacteriales bacterium]|nr:isoamylase early set domain-containing protein [Mycobacteriales bacterium]
MIRSTRVAKTGDVKVTFVQPQDEPAGTISVVGDFNDWRPGTHVLSKRTNGTRSVSVILPAASKFRFRYLGENGNWFDDETVERDGDAGLLTT